MRRRVAGDARWLYFAASTEGVVLRAGLSG